jgi:hypothetical protein
MTWLYNGTPGHRKVTERPILDLEHKHETALCYGSHVLKTRLTFCYIRLSVKLSQNVSLFVLRFSTSA